MAEEMETILETVRELRAEGLAEEDVVTRVAALSLPDLIQRRDRVVRVVYSQLED